MKKIKSLFILLIAFIVTSCSDEFLETVPTDSVASAVVFSNIDNAWGAINGIHRELYWSSPGDSQDEGGFSSIMISLDVLGEDLVHPSTVAQWFSGDYRWQSHTSSTNSLPDYNWEQLYLVVADANQIIANIDAVVGAQEEIDNIKGQALVYRAWAYHYLVQMFGVRYVIGGTNTGLGIPLYTEPVFEPAARSTVAEVYAQINSDLDDAISLLNGASDRNNKSHIDVSVARGVKARVALTQGLWSVAISNAAAALADYTLMDNATYQNGFNDYENPEWMWGSHVQEDQHVFFWGFHAFMSYNFSSSNIRGNPKCMFGPLHDAIPVSDVRSTLFAPTGIPPEMRPTPASLTAPYHAIKFKSVGESPNSNGDHPYMRAAEMYLIKAEAEQRNGNDVAAAQTLFELNSNRDASYTLSTNTGQALLDEIWLYRRAELWGEGFRFLDLKRNNLTMDRQQGVGNHNASATANLWTVPAGDNRWNWLIPQAEIDTNPLIIQNEL